MVWNTRKFMSKRSSAFPRKGGCAPSPSSGKTAAVSEIDRIKFIDRAPARVSAVLPMRYTCVMGGREKYLYFEEERLRWFVERERL